VYSFIAWLTLRKIKVQADLMKEQLDDSRKSSGANELRANATLAAIEKQATAMEDQLAAMKEAGRHTEGLAQQAVSQTELTQAQMVLSNRPWISVEVAPSSPLFFDERGCVLMLQVTTRNVGHSVAKHISLWPGFAVAGAQMPHEVLNGLSGAMKTPGSEDSDYGSLLFPDQMRVEQIPVIAPLDVIQKAIEADPFKVTGSIGLHLAICVDYQSTFDPKRRHQTKFIYLVGRPDPKGFLVGIFDTRVKTYERILLTPTGHNASAD
jgi:hypothetical protein